MPMDYPVAVPQDRRAAGPDVIPRTQLLPRSSGIQARVFTCVG